MLAGAAVAYWASYMVDRRPQGAMVVGVFKSSGARFKRLEVNGWAAVKDPMSSEKEAKAFLIGRLTKIPCEGGLPQVRGVRQDGMFTARTGVRVKGGVTANVALQQYYGDKPFGAGETCLVISLATENPAASYRSLDTIFDALCSGCEGPQKSTVVSGYIGGRVDRRAASQIIAKMLNEATAQNVVTVSEGPLVSISAYTSRVPRWLTDGKKSVNINMALRYNSVENRTFLYVGSPLITSEY